MCVDVAFANARGDRALGSGRARPEARQPGENGHARRRAIASTFLAGSRAQIERSFQRVDDPEVPPLPARDDHAYDRKHGQKQ